MQVCVHAVSLLFSFRFSGTRHSKTQFFPRLYLAPENPQINWTTKHNCSSNDVLRNRVLYFQLNCVPTQNWQRVISINPLSPGGCGGNLVSGTKSDRFGRQRTLCTRRIGSRGCAEITVNPSSAYRYVKGRITGFQVGVALYGICPFLYILFYY